MMHCLSAWLNRFFALEKHHTTIRTEVLSGATTAPALIFVGILMLSSVKDVDLHNMGKAMPAFCTIVFMPFTYSIANGIAFGLITHCLILMLTGKAREIKPLTVIVALVFAARYAFITLG